MQNATAYVISRRLLNREAALTANNKKARYFEERARKTKDVTRRKRFTRGVSLQTCHSQGTRGRS